MAGIATAISYLIGKVKKNKKEDSMGNSSSHAPHEPLDRSVFQRGVYGDVKNTVNFPCIKMHQIILNSLVEKLEFKRIIQPFVHYLCIINST